MSLVIYNQSLIHGRSAMEDTSSDPGKLGDLNLKHTRCQSKNHGELIYKFKIRTDNLVILRNVIDILDTMIFRLVTKHSLKPATSKC